MERRHLGTSCAEDAARERPGGTDEDDKKLAGWVISIEIWYNSAAGRKLSNDMLNQRRGLTENLLGKIGLSIITFLVGAIFSAGVAYEQLREMTKDISELKAETYSHEDGKLLSESR